LLLLLLLLRCLVSQGLDGIATCIMAVLVSSALQSCARLHAMLWWTVNCCKSRQ
jgi:hypothetical protein